MGITMAPYAEEGCKLFVYGVNEGTSNSELQEQFEKFGTVTDTYNTGKGYAFVTFNNKESASEATERLNGQEVLGQVLKVNVARPKLRRRWWWIRRRWWRLWGRWWRRSWIFRWWRWWWMVICQLKVSNGKLVMKSIFAN